MAKGTLKQALKNYKWYFIVAAAVVAISGVSFVGGCYYGTKKILTASQGTQELKPIGPGKTGIIPPIPVTCDDYKKCAKSELSTKFILKDNIATIRVWDLCKYKEDKYKIPVLFFRNSLMFTPGIGLGGYTGHIVPIFGGSILYTRNFTPFFGIGGGMFYYTSVDKSLWNAGAQISFTYSW